MTVLESVVPNVGRMSAEDVLKQLSQADQVPPFDERVVHLFETLSRVLLRDGRCRAFPDLIALGFWMRRNELEQLEVSFRNAQHGSSMLVPRGLVFHVPPANVDTIFIYAWLLSTLVGNRSIIRLSRRESPVVDLLCTLLRELLAQPEHAVVARSTMVIRYPHDDHVTAMLSAACDVRVLWGGDRTIQQLRRFPLPPGARELTFPDRWSLVAMDAHAYTVASDAVQCRVVEAFVNDAYLFDQAACSSPRLVYWSGDLDSCGRASLAFFARVHAELERRGLRIETGQVLQKQLFTYQAMMDEDTTNVRVYSNQLTTIAVHSFASLSRNHCGGGVFYVAEGPDLASLVQHLQAKDQTLAVFGFEREVLVELVRELNGRAVDRIVPMGQALSFHRYWDGMDLLMEFCRVVHMPKGEALW